MSNKKITRVYRDAMPQYEEVCVLNLDIRCWGAKSAMDVERWGMDKNLCDAFQDILDDKTVVSQIDDLRKEAKRWVAKPINSVKHPIEGLKAVYKARVARIDEKLTEYSERFWAMVENVIESLPELESQFAKNNPDYYDPSKYPTGHQVRRAFRFTWRFMSFAPLAEDGNHALPPSFYIRQEMRAKEEYRQVVDEGIKVIGGLFLNKVDSLRKQCFDGTINTKTVETFADFLDNFDQTYGKFLGHAKLKAAIDKAKEYMVGTDADMLRASDNFRGMVGEKMEEILKDINLANDVRLHRNIDL